MNRPQTGILRWVTCFLISQNPLHHLVDMTVFSLPAWLQQLSRKLASSKPNQFIRLLIHVPSQGFIPATTSALSKDYKYLVWATPAASSKPIISTTKEGMGKRYMAKLLTSTAWSLPSHTPCWPHSYIISGFKSWSLVPYSTVEIPLPEHSSCLRRQLTEIFSRASSDGQ